MRTWRHRSAAALAVLAVAATACGSDAVEPGDGGERLAGSIEVDGSSTVGPLTDAIAEEYATARPDVTVNLSVSGSGGGFERFCNVGDTHISNASRPITDDEAAACEEAGIAFTEIRVGTDALTMVTNPATDFLECLTTDELVTLWGPDGADTWDQVNPDFPAEPIQIFAPGADSGTYDFFNETVLAPAGIEQPRQDFNASEDDNIIVQGVRGTPGAWGFFGYAYLQQNPDAVKAIAHDAGDGCVAPSADTAQDGSYALARPLFIYVRDSALDQAHVADFVTFYLDTVNDVIEDVGYLPASDDELDQARSRVESAIG